MKRLVRQVLEHAGYTALASDHPAARYVQHPPQTAFESTVLRRFPSLHGLSFVQIGANDGQRFDPIARFIGPYAWRGVMLEPLPTYFAALAARHRDNPRLKLVQAALDVRRGRRLIHRLDPSLVGLPDWAHGLASFDRARVETIARELGQLASAVLETEIDTLTWDEIWTGLGQRTCDILILDTEGYDLALLRAAELARIRPSLVHFEHACVSPADRLAFYGELLALGYEIASDGPDTTAWRIS